MPGFISNRTALLQALSQGPGYGLQLIDRISETSNGHLVLNRGRVYVVLAKLEDEGMVRSYEREEMTGTERANDPRRGGGKPRRWYELTELGRTEWQRVQQFVLEKAQ